MATTHLKKPIRRRLEATDRRRRPFIITIYPSGAIEIAPRRLKPESITVDAIYRQAVANRVRAESALKPKRRVLVKRGII